MSAAIPKDVKEEVKQRVDSFNQEVLATGNSSYSVRFRGKYAYLDRSDSGRAGSIGRLEYTGDTTDWEFAIFKWSTEEYDPNEWFFPGSDELDGTIEGAMKAGLKAYPA